MNLHSEHQNLETMKGSQVAFEMAELSEDKDRNALARLGKQSVLKVRKLFSRIPFALTTEFVYHNSRLTALN